MKRLKGTGNLKNQISYSAIKAFLWIGLFVVTAGCGNIMSPGRQLGAPSQGLLGGGGNFGPPRNYQCPSGFNVLPIVDPLTGDGYYQVCRKTGEASQLSVWGTPSQSPTVCVYPAEEDQNGNLFLKVDLSQTQAAPVKECVTLQSYFNEVPASNRFQQSSFSLVRFTHVFVVEEPDSFQFERCMGFHDRANRGVNLSLCPNPNQNSGIVSMGDLRNINHQ